MSTQINRRKVVQGLGATASLPWIAPSQAQSNPILIGVPSSQTAAAGVADHLDHLQGTKLAVEEINASGGVLGRQIKLVVVDCDVLSAESVKQAMAALVDAKVDAITHAFSFVPIVAMDASAKYQCPFLNGNAQRAATEAFRKDPVKYAHVFQVAPSEVNYGWTYPIWLDHEEKKGVWKPKNRKVHIIQEQVGYCQTISKAAQEAIRKNGKWQVARITDIQYPVQDWAPVIREMREVDAAAIMVDHWVAAEYAAFCKQFVANPVPNSLVYLQYGPSQPEFLTLAGASANGFCWSTVMGIYGDAQGKAYRAKYAKRFPKGIMGQVYTGIGYDMVQTLKKGWTAVGDPRKFKEVSAWLRKNPQKGVCGYSDMNNQYQEALHYPDNGFDTQSAQLDKGVAQLFYQVQNTQHNVIFPNEVSESKLQKAPWWS